MLIYYFTSFLQITTNFQSGAFKSVKTREKGIEILHRGPYGKYKSNIHEEVLLSTIHMCHNFAERTLPFHEFEREVPGRKPEQRMAGPAASAGRNDTGAGGEGQRESREPRAPVGQLSSARGGPSWPDHAHKRP